MMKRYFILLLLFVLQPRISFAAKNDSAVYMQYPNTLTNKSIQSANFYNNSTCIPKVFTLGNTAYYHPNTIIQWEYIIQIPKLDQAKYSIKGCMASLITINPKVTITKSQKKYVNLEIIGHLKTKKNILTSINLKSISIENKTKTINFNCSIIDSKL